MEELNSKESGLGADSDQDFDPTAEMLVNDFDDEHTLDEEEALTDDLAATNEIDELTKEQDIPIEELIRMYYDPSKQPESSEKQDSSNVLDSSDSSKTNLASQPQSSNNNNNNNNNNNSNNHYNSLSDLLSDSSSDYSDFDFNTNDDEWRRTIQVGSDFQAIIPIGLNPYDENFIDPDDICLWKPCPVLSVDKLKDYLMEYARLSKNDDEGFSLPSGSHIKDDEQALYTLFKCKYHAREALRMHVKGNEPPAPLSESMTPWTEDECRSFENGLREFGKEFFQIKTQRIPSRGVGEVVSFYYLWKKTERHDLFTAKYRIEKKKYSLHPGTTDYMDRFLDEQENVSFNMHINNMNNAPNVQMLSTQNNITSPSSSSSNHHHNMTSHLSHHQQAYIHNNSRQSSHHLAQQSSSSSRSHHHLSSDTGYRVNNNNNNSSSISITTSGHHGRTINVSNDVPQTILINDSDFISSNDDKPIVVCTGSSNNKSGYYGNNTSSLTDPSSNTTTIVVGKNPVVIDGTWVSSSSTTSSSSSSSSPSSTVGGAQSVSIYKLPYPSTYNR